MRRPTIDGPRSPPNPPSPRAKIDRFCVHSNVPSGAVTVVSLQITAALPLSQMSVNRVTALAEPEGGSGAGTSTRSLACSTLPSSMSMPGNCTVGGFGLVEGGGDVAECRQHLRGVVDQITQLAGVHRIGAGAQSQVVELDIAADPREFDRLQLGGQRDVYVDRHVSSAPPAMCSAAR